MTSKRVVIVGAGAAGISAARVLAGHPDVTVTMIARTGETPYSRMLIKGVAYGPTPPEMIRLPLPPVDLVTDTAERIATDQMYLQLASGTRIGFDALIIATGSAPRGLDRAVAGADAAAAADRIATLHSVEDALRIKGALQRHGSTRVAIYGAGLIASEASSTLSGDGHDVTLIARSATPGVSTFGAAVAERVAADHLAHVKTHLGRTISQVDVGDIGLSIGLDDGSAVAADLLVLALGTTPTGPAPWSDGVDVDDRLRTGIPGIYAAGGVSTHQDDILGRWRIDHWDDGTAQGAHAATVALHDFGFGSDPGPYRPRSPYVSMIYGRAIAGAGYTGHPNTQLVDGDDFLVTHVHNDMVVGVSGIDAVASVYRWGPRLHGVQD
ncbi:FAD-dependent oxidoreductase [Promicromonospora sp. NPDC050880]|uniref:FAD-dependent oxidoreductase n=1 Tax=Promicromonospora sp. NPDC050880 TaxID=3364406 RepID=UPI00379BD169